MPTDSERIADLERIVTELQSVIGDYHDRADMAKRPTELPNGEYPIMFRQRQLGLGTDDLSRAVALLTGKVVALEAKSAATQGSSMLPLTAAAGDVGVRHVKLVPPDPIIQPGQETQHEVAGAQRFTGPVQFDAEVGLGGAPLKGVPAAVRKGGAITFLIRQAEADTQEFRTGEGTGDRLRSGMIYLEPYDEGVRLLQGAYYADGKLHQTQEKVSILAMDSQGILSKSTGIVKDGKLEPGQEFVFEESDEWITLSIRKAGKGFRVGCNSETGHLNERGLNDRTVELVKPMPVVDEVIT